MKDKRNYGFVCKSCDFLDYTGELDQCPYCRNDDWKRVVVEKCKSCLGWMKKELKEVLKK